MRRKTLFAMVLIGLACSTAQASEWVSLGKSDDGTTETFIDAASIEDAIDIRRAWVETLFESHTQPGTGQYAQKWIHHWFSREAFHCNAKTFRSETTTIFYDDGSSSSGRRTLGPWEPVPPDTLRYAEMKFICAWKPK